MYTNVIKQGHDGSFYDAFGMTKPVFRKLVQELHEIGGVRSTRYMSVTERVAIFLHIAVTGMAFRHAMQRFQRSSDTISRFD